MSFPTYFDGPRVTPNKWDRGENGIYFRALLDYWCFENGNKEKYPGSRLAITETFSPKNGYFRANPPEDTDHFSIDNMLGLYALTALHLNEEAVRELPVFYWNGRLHLHPNSWMVFLAAKYDWLKILFYPFIFLMAMYSASSPYDDTTGFNLWWLRCKMLGYTEILRRMDYAIEQKALHAEGALNKQFSLNGMFSGFEFSFSYYFTFRYEWHENLKEHPIIREVFEFHNR